MRLSSYPHSFALLLLSLSFFQSISGASSGPREVRHRHVKRSSCLPRNSNLTSTAAAEQGSSSFLPVYGSASHGTGTGISSGYLSSTVGASVHYSNTTRPSTYNAPASSTAAASAPTSLAGTCTVSTTTVTETVNGPTVTVTADATAAAPNGYTPAAGNSLAASAVPATLTAQVSGSLSSGEGNSSGRSAIHASSASGGPDQGYNTFGAVSLASSSLASPIVQQSSAGAGYTSPALSSSTKTKCKISAPITSAASPVASSGTSISGSINATAVSNSSFYAVGPSYARTMISSANFSSPSSAQAAAAYSPSVRANASSYVADSAGTHIKNALASNTTNSSSAAIQAQAFYAGADIGTLVRMENIPGRHFYDYDGTTVKDPIQTLADAGVNALRVETGFRQCLGPTIFDNSNVDLVQEELTFSLDWGCIDTQVSTAQRGVALGMKLVLTINMGQVIPADWESYTYAQMAAGIQNETKRQLQPFLDAKLLPDIILLENEGSDGFLSQSNVTGQGRTGGDDVLCGQIPTGNMASYPQLAGFYKAEILACNDAIAAAGMSNATVRYGLHSHGQYVQWKESVVHGPNQASQTNLTTPDGKVCDFTTVIPADLLNANVSTMLTIMGHSAYPDPMIPSSVNGSSTYPAMFDRNVQTLTQLQGYAEAYGKHTSGPFAGQWILQSLGVEYATSFRFPYEIDAQVTNTEMMWNTLKKFDSFLGMMWYEPWYCYADLDGGLDSMCHTWGDSGSTNEAPTDTLKTWGAGAVSPWKS